MGFSRALNPALPVFSFVLHAEALALTAAPGWTRRPAATVGSQIATPPGTDAASSQRMVNQSLTAEAPVELSPPLVNADPARAVPQDYSPQDYAINHWRRHESETEHAFRVMRAEEKAQALFARATVRQKDAYDAAMADLRRLRAPRHDRLRAAALRVWRDTTQDARTLYFRTCDALMREGEIPEELDRAWTGLIDPARAARLWADG